MMGQSSHGNPTICQCLSTALLEICLNHGRARPLLARYDTLQPRRKQINDNNQMRFSRQPAINVAGPRVQPNQAAH
ncbi:predicted protein [Botrytis cinerea T4]|uniref:Uncharacterized protein n=1 Tax=Botryotinia fuckeliana (strain T4) TaxID=999810 RepID=G2YDI2_BOTF4|nr:predicted protein [Botrytis cinerea T4]